ncbi:adenylate/guanylate cyclase domain-containing protein [Streptomyces sp. SID14478]|uniref:adenylate/guanylate cyclase domain-containing protein n=1 Tax=Streptomyces sp. SID14478 TaxID=2706073 RepID=UPI0013DB0B3C|nr:adenylate/guanylate cyclase domain-containing protein [Streptomyces sp. SID14478]NEB79290.1 adenylate/guanylate cyclase domain-containing protein [Streptomyces sp. SID14478]
MSATRATGPSDGDELRGAMEELLLGGSRTWTRRDIAERSGVGSERSAQIWRALGFPVVDDEARVFTDADVEALRAGERLIAAGLITEDSETMMARALGHHLSRLAEWQMHTLGAWLHHAPGASGASGASGDEAAFLDHATALLPEIELLQRHVWRRHLAAHAARMLADAPGNAADAPGRRPGPGTVTEARADADVRHLAVGFSDMVGYTRMTRGLDSTALVRVIDRFESLTGDVVAEGRGRVVKTIGDEVLFVAESASAAAAIALELTARAQAEQSLPEVRTGLAHGPVLQRFGDVYGAAVNIAARLTAVARPHTVLVDTAFAGELAGAAAHRLKVLRPVSVRGYSRLRPVLLRPAGPAGSSRS